GSARFNVCLTDLLGSLLVTLIGRKVSPKMGHAPRRLVSALYVKPPWVPVEVRIGQKWRRANVLRQADRRGLCLVSIRGPAPESDPIMVPLSTIRIPSDPPVARKRPDTRPNFRVKKPTAEGGSE
uniref:Uncharacterized protein n=1 Tax=Aegilops tauschii subsp. strangulata TaxID=200361 RepID=A0A453SRT9_AEGTS